MAGVERGGGCAGLRHDELTTGRPRAVQVAQGHRVTWYLWREQHRRDRRQSARYVTSRPYR